MRRVLGLSIAALVAFTAPAAFASLIPNLTSEGLVYGGSDFTFVTETGSNQVSCPPGGACGIDASGDSFNNLTLDNLTINPPSDGNNGALDTVVTQTDPGPGDPPGVSSVSVASVPEPASLGLFGAALAGLGLFGRRRRKRS